ncbi:MAG: transposase [Syntrophomonadaceae bacterium]
MYGEVLAADALFAAGRFHYVTIFTRDEFPLFEDCHWAELLLNIFTFNKYALNYRVFGFVIMPSHLHIIIYPCKVPLSQIILKNTANFTRYYHMISGDKDLLWAKDYYSHQISDYDSLHKVQNFIHLNPVRNNLVRTPDEYVYTSFRFYCRDTGEFSLLLDEIGI